MDEIQRADPAGRRQAVWFVVAGALVGSLLLAGFERYRTPLQDWLLSEPEQSADRLRLLLLLLAISALAPRFGFAAYLWSFSGRVLRAQQFPPPGYRVVRDTPVLRGSAALSRAQSLKVLAVCLGVAAAVLWLLFWRLAALLSRASA